MTPAQIRAQPLDTFAEIAESVADSASVLAIFAAPEWAELHEDGQRWVAGIVREAMARGAECRA